MMAALLCLGAQHRSANFVVDAPTPEIARQVGEAAEAYRVQLAHQWLGHTLPDWSAPCPIKAHVAPHLGAGGVTSFLFDRGEVFGWNMTIQGSLERVLDSVLPHEVTHTIFASHFRQPLPRWADEGACTTVEHPTERAKQQRMLIEFLRTGRGISFSHMLRMKEYPADVLPLYAQGHSLATFLIGQGGRQKFLEYLAAGMQSQDWVAATRQYYGYQGLGNLQNSWLDWVQQGSPPLENSSPQAPAADEQRATSLASASAPRRQRPEPNLIFRAQSEDDSATPQQAAPAAAARGAGRQGQVLSAGEAADEPADKLVAVERGLQAPRAPYGTKESAAATWSSPAGLDKPSETKLAQASAKLNWKKPGQRAAPNPAKPPAASGDGAKLAQDSSNVVRTQAVRPQGPQRSGQIILEWSREGELAPPPAARRGIQEAAREPVIRRL
jgi:hypothetical protein